MAGARADLLAIAGDLASAAREGDTGTKAEMVPTIKTALEAAALAENTSAGEVDEALSGIQDLLEQAGVLAESVELSTAEFLAQTYKALVAWRDEAVAAQGFEVAYDVVRGLAEGLERDFIAGDSEVSRRLAARIRTRLDDATTVLNHAKQGGTDGTKTAGWIEG